MSTIIYKNVDRTIGGDMKTQTRCDSKVMSIVEQNENLGHPLRSRVSFFMNILHLSRNKPLTLKWVPYCVQSS